jgi:glycosyltransferase involved in cell wall biosynthesis
VDLKHLLILIPGFPKNEDDTTCLPAVQQFLLCYQRQFPGVKISLISLHYPYHHSFYQWNGIDVYPIGGKNQAGIKKAKIISKAIFVANKINRRAKIDTVLSFWLTDAALTGKLIAHFLRAPHFIWMQGQDARGGNKYMRWVKPDLNRLATLSEYQNEVLYKNYSLKAAHVINNGINDAIFPVFNDHNREIDLLAAGSLIPLKQYHLFIELIKYLKENGHENIKAVLAGDGILSGTLRELVIKYNLEKNIELTGELPHKTVLNLMNNAKIFIHPSEYESQSTVALEALYSGCNVLSFLPIGNKYVDSFFFCTDFSEMRDKTMHLLSHPLPAARIKYNDMEESAAQMHSILQSLG